MSVNKSGVLERLLSIFAEVEGQLNQSHPRGILALLRTRLTSTLSTYQEYGLLDSVLLISFLRNLFDMRFEQRVRILSKEELAKSSIRPGLKSMIVREFEGLDVDEHFDYDYIVVFDKLEADMTTLKQIKGIVTEEEYRAIQNEIVNCISKAIEKALEELQQVNQGLLEVTQKELREKQTIQALDDCLRKFVRRMHIQVLGWPSN